MWIFRVSTVFQIFQYYPKFPMKMKLCVKGGFDRTPPPQLPSESAIGAATKEPLWNGQKNQLLSSLLRTCSIFCFVYTLRAVKLVPLGLLCSLLVHVYGSVSKSKSSPVQIIFSRYVAFKGHLYNSKRGDPIKGISSWREEFVPNRTEFLPIRVYPGNAAITKYSHPEAPKEGDVGNKQWQNKSLKYETTKAQRKKNSNRGTALEWSVEKTTTVEPQ